MAKKRTNRDLAERIAEKILKTISKKVDRFEDAQRQGDISAMWEHQLTEAEESFLQIQQRLDQEADAIDAHAGILDDLTPSELDRLYERLASFDDTPLDLPSMPEIEDEQDNV